jgi:hypothetical protein
MVAKIHVAPSGIIAGATARLQQVGIVLRSRPSGLRRSTGKLSISRGRNQARPSVSLPNMNRPSGISVG